jgi:diacylglycerol O-acyltransferase
LSSRLSALDAAFLHLETDNVPMNAAGLAILDPSTRPQGRLDIEDLTELVASRINLVPRLRQKLAPLPFRAGRPVWVDDPDFDVRSHVHRAVVPFPGGRNELTRVVDRLRGRVLDRSRPLWDMYLIDGLEQGRVGLLIMWHHAMVDGMGAVAIAGAILNDSPRVDVGNTPKATPLEDLSPIGLLTGALRDHVVQPLRAAAGGVALAVRKPRAAAEQATRLRDALSSIRESYPPSRPAEPGPFNAPVGPHQRFVMTELQLADVKAVKDALGAKVNDVVFTCVAGALSGLLDGRGVITDGVQLRTLVPLSIRTAAQRDGFGNHASAYLIDLPIGRMDPVRRLRLIAAQTRRIRPSDHAVATPFLMQLSNWIWMPSALAAASVRRVAHKDSVHLIVSPVRGPRATDLTLAGARHLITYPIPPVGRRLALVISTASVGQTMGFGITADRQAVPDVDLIPTGVQRSFDDLRAAAGLDSGSRANRLRILL